MMEGYKDSALGLIPIDWEVVKLSEICDVRDGTHDSPKYVDNGIPFVTSKNLTDTTLSFDNIKYISNEDHLYFSKRSHVENGDILFGMIGTVGKPIIVEEDFEFSIKNVALLKFSDNIVLNNTFAKNVLKSSLVLNQFKKISNGGVLNFVALGNIRSLDFPVPPLPEQQKIADILSTVDAKIKVIDQQIKETEELKKGLMQRLFTKGIGHTEFKDSLLGEIPKSWEVVPINSLGDVVTGSTPKTAVNEYYSEEGILWASPSDLTNVKYINSTKKRLTPLGFEQTRKLPPKSILVTCIGSTIGKIGMTNSWMSTNQQINSIVCSDLNDSEFYYYVIEKNADYIKSMAGTQAVPLLNKTDFSIIPVIKPTLNEQRQIGKILCSVDEKLNVLGDKKIHYQELKKGLMQQLLTGMIRVNNLVEA